MYTTWLLSEQYLLVHHNVKSTVFNFQNLSYKEITDNLITDKEQNVDVIDIDNIKILKTNVNNWKKNDKKDS